MHSEMCITVHWACLYPNFTDSLGEKLSDSCVHMECRLGKFQGNIGEGEFIVGIYQLSTITHRYTVLYQARQRKEDLEDCPRCHKD